MKKSTKRDIAISCSVLALGCFLIAAGWGMGGRLNTGREISIGGFNGVYMGSDGLRIGGSNGVYVGPAGISIGGKNGIYVGPEGIHIGGEWVTYVEEDKVMTEDIDRVWEFSEAGNEGEATWALGSTIGQNIEVDAFDRLEVDIDLGDISVVQDGAGYYVDLQDNVEGYELHYSFDGSTLVINSTGERNMHWGTTNAQAAVTVILPKGAELKSIDLHSSLGDVYAGEFEETVTSANLKTDLGDVIWDNSLVKELTAHSSLGNVTVMLPSMEKVGYELSTSLGEVIVDNEVMAKDKVSYQPRDGESYVYADSDLGDVYLGAG